MTCINKKGTALYPIRAAARLTQLSIETLRAWEKRYKAVQPVRRKGIRLYSDADIERLSLLRRAIQHGHSIGHASRLSNKELLSLRDAVGASRAAESNDPPIERILAAIDEFHYGDADRELGRLASLMPPRDVIHKIALPLMRIVGEHWHEQRMRIAQEHLISQLLGNLLGSIIRIYAPVHSPALLMTATFERRPSRVRNFGGRYPRRGCGSRRRPSRTESSGQ